MLVMFNGIMNANRSLKITGIIGLLMIPMGIMFKIQHWPLGGLLILCSILTASLTPLISTFTNKKHLVLLLTLYVWMLIHNLGVIFKMNHWPAGGLIFILATHSMFIPALVLATYLFRKTNSQMLTDGNV